MSAVEKARSEVQLKWLSARKWIRQRRVRFIESEHEPPIRRARWAYDIHANIDLSKQLLFGEKIPPERRRRAAERERERVARKRECRLRCAWQQESRVKDLNHRITTTISTTVTIDETVDSDLRIDHSWEEIDTRPAYGCKGNRRSLLGNIWPHGAMIRERILPPRTLHYNREAIHSKLPRSPFLSSSTCIIVKNVKFCGSLIFSQITGMQRSISSRWRALSCPRRNILSVIVIHYIRFGRRNYPINHYYSEIFLVCGKRIGVTPAPWHIHHLGKHSDNAFPLFRVVHAMRDHSVYDTYGV